MEIMFLLVPVSVVLVFIIGALFWWSLRHGQFDDLEGPAYRILMDDDTPPKSGDTVEAEKASGVASSTPSAKKP
jgi:cbb3-type cytochrome oxidase maturation protein